jgi:hypothetical protein
LVADVAGIKAELLARGGIVFVPNVVKKYHMNKE